MQALILAAILNYPVTPMCQQWQQRMERESGYAARLVWSPKKQRHQDRSDRAAAKVQQHCAVAVEQDDVVVVAEPVASSAANAAGF